MTHYFSTYRIFIPKRYDCYFSICRFTNSMRKIHSDLQFQSINNSFIIMKIVKV
jgi:hypothetical protein